MVKRRLLRHPHDIADPRHRVLQGGGDHLQVVGVLGSRRRARARIAWLIRAIEPFDARTCAAGESFSSSRSKPRSR